jgi:hypothetical protein
VLRQANAPGDPWNGWLAVGAAWETAPNVAALLIDHDQGATSLAMGNQLAPIPRLALTREEAAAAIGMSVDSFERHVQPTLRLVRRGRLRLVPVGELERWLSENAERAI